MRHRWGPGRGGTASSKATGGKRGGSPPGMRRRPLADEGGLGPTRRLWGPAQCGRHGRSGGIAKSGGMKNNSTVSAWYIISCGSGCAEHERLCQSALASSSAARSRSSIHSFVGSSMGLVRILPHAVRLAGATELRSRSGCRVWVLAGRPLPDVGGAPQDTLSSRAERSEVEGSRAGRRGSGR